MKISIFAEGTNGLRRSGMELEAVIDQRHSTGTSWCYSSAEPRNTEVVAIQKPCGLQNATCQP